MMVQLNNIGAYVQKYGFQKQDLEDCERFFVAASRCAVAASLGDTDPDY